MSSEEIETCENGVENCYHDDFESMSDECKEYLRDYYEEARHDTYD